MDDKLYQVAKFYQEKLNNKHFLLVATKKNKILTFEIFFNSSKFFHLIGLHKLKDLDISTPRLTYQEILSKKLRMEDIKRSKYFLEMEERIDNFEKIGKILSSPNDMRKSLYGSFGLGRGIKADYLLSQKDEKYLHLFLIKDKGDIVVPVTFFTHDNELYLSKNTTRWNIVDVEELTEKDNVKRKAELMELKAKLSTSTSRSFAEMREIVRDTVHVRSSNTKNNDKDEHDD